MTIREWCYKNIDFINREEIQQLENILATYKRLGDLPKIVTEIYIPKNEKRLKELHRKPNITGIAGRSSNPETNKMFDEELTSVKIVRKSKSSKNQFIIFNNNIWVMPGRKYFILRRDNRSYVTDAVEVI